MLAAHGLPATFFVVGKALREHRALVERAHAEGHRVGNHTLTHPRPLGESSDPVAEIAATQDELGPLGAERLFRPSGAGGAIEPGLLSPPAVTALVAGGFTCVLWNAVPGDWRDPDGWVERALAQCRAAGRTLLVLHDLPTGAMDHLERFLDAALAEGMRFTQALPEACLPIVRGVVVRPLDRLGG